MPYAVTRWLAPLTALILTALGGLACSLTETANVVVTATPSQIAVTATPEPPTATPAPPPPPTVIPFAAIQEANAALFNGNYVAAVRVYRSILDQPVTSVNPQLRADAAFGLGQAALREGQFAEALPALTEFISTYVSDPRLAWAYFLRGDAYMGLSQWPAAIADFLTYLQKRPGLIDSYAYERIGDASLALGDTPQALANYDQAVKSSRGLVPLLLLREKLAAAYLNAGNLTGAIAQYDGILQEARNPGYRAAINFSAADALIKAGNTNAALPRLQDIVDTAPESASAYRAMQTLLANNVPVNNLVRGRISFAAKDYQDAITALHNYTSVTPLGQIDPNVYMLLGRAYREVGNTAAANTAFQTILVQYPTSPQFGEAWLEQGRSLFLANQIPESIAKYIELSEKHPNVSQGAEALWRAGYLYSTLGNTEQSLATFEILGNKYPGTERAQDGLFRAGMAAYNRGERARASRLFALLANTGSGDLAAAGYLWLGRLYQLDNQPRLAQDAYAQAAKTDPGGYYSLRAADLLAGAAPLTPPAAYDWAFNTPDQIAAAEVWLREKFQIVGGGVLWLLSAELEQDPRMVRGAELWAVAAYTEAKAEFEALTTANERNPLAMYQLAAYYHRIGNYREGIVAAAKLIDGAGVRTEEAPKFIASLRFPIAYYDLVLPATQQYGLDPLLVFALMRQESLFQGLATSSAQAQGLMQIIPGTGEYIARKLNWQDYQNSDLYRPYVNVVFGVYYLYEQVQQFKNVYAALAAYNAGPGRAAEWLQISNGDPDLFVQAVSFDETQTYIRRIYEQYAVYRALYAAR